MSALSLLCPACGGVLVKEGTGRSSHTTDEARFGVSVTVDVCLHGTWFDRGEAWAILQAAAIKQQEAEFARQIDEAGRLPKK